MRGVDIMDLDVITRIQQTLYQWTAHIAGTDEADFRLGSLHIRFLLMVGSSEFACPAGTLAGYPD